MVDWLIETDRKNIFNNYYGKQKLEPAVFTPNTGKRTALFRQDEVVQIISEFLN